MPIAVSIESKTAGEGGRAAQDQMAVWLLAQFEKLRLLAGPDETLPTLPFFIAQGPHWFFGAAKKTGDRMVSRLCSLTIVD